MKKILLGFVGCFLFLSPDVKAVTSITQYNLTWTFDKDYPSGQFCNGDYWVVGPLKIIGITTDLHAPGFTPEPGEDGTMVNPGTTDKQGYDNRLKSYDASLNAGLVGGKPISADNPLAINADSSVVSMVSWLLHSPTDAEPGCPKINGATKEPRPATHSAAVLTVLMKAPPDGSFRPPYAGTDKTIKFNASQLDLSKLKNLKPVAGTPDLASVEKSVTPPWIDHVHEFLGAMVHPTNNMPQYGRELGFATDEAALMLNLDFSQLPGSPTKNKLLIGYTQLGIDFTGIADNGGGWPANGGHGIGRKLPILIAGLVLNDAHMKDVGQWKTRFQEDETTFYVSQADVDMTHSAKWAPDYRNVGKTPYETTDIGMPEWGIHHAVAPENDDADWDAVYRGVNGPVMSAMTAAIRIMGIEDAWNHKALLDYADRFMKKTGGKGNAGSMSPFEESMWAVSAAMTPSKTEAGAAKGP
jgi:hypothetical protein